MDIHTALISIPACAIVLVAVLVTRRERADRVDTEIVGLTDAPCIRMADVEPPPGPPCGPATCSGDLVSPPGTDSLGARLRSTASNHRPRQTPIGSRTSGRVVVTRRRREPLVARR